MDLFKEQTHCANRSSLKNLYFIACVTVDKVRFLKVETSPQLLNDANDANAYKLVVYNEAETHRGQIVDAQ